MQTIRQASILIRHYASLELSAKERLSSAILFAMTILLLFTFAQDQSKTAQELMPSIFVSQIYLATFLALQLSISRVNESESQDQIFDIMRTYPLRPDSWFLAKFCYLLVTGTLIATATTIMGMLFFSGLPNLDLAMLFKILVICVLTIMGTSGIGVLLSHMAGWTSHRQMLFPILFFPLTAPVLIAAVVATRQVLNLEATLTDLWASWLGLLVVFDVVYCTLGLLLFGIVIKAE